MALASFWRGWSSREGGMRADAASLRGHRDENQDNWLILPREPGMAAMLRDGEPFLHPVPDWPEGWLRVVVADGMGGHRQGRQIAERVMNALIRIPPRATPHAMRESLFRLHQEVMDPSHRDDTEQPGCTLVLADLKTDSGQGVLAHVGDCRACLLHADAPPTFLTWDHTHLEFNWRDGQLDDERYEQLLSRGTSRQPSQAVGYGSLGIVFAPDGSKPYCHNPGLRLDLAGELPADKRAHADVIAFRLARDQRLLLASDGLWRGEGEWRPGRGESAADMAEAGMRRGSRDNVTVVLCGYY